MRDQKEIYESSLKATNEIGIVTQILPTLVHVTGLPNARIFEGVVFETGELGQIIALNIDYVEVITFTTKPIRSGTKVTRTGKVVETCVGKELLGSVIDPLGNRLDGKEGFSKVEYRPIDITPSGMNERQSVNQPLETGFPIVDLLIPLGLGQRELIVGDRKTGKTSFLLTILKNQIRLGNICVYASIGKRKSDIDHLYKFFLDNKILDKIVLVSSSSSDATGLIFLTPYAAMSVAEYFRDQGNNVLLILDDLSIHASSYREITLLAKRFPGRGSYPGDIFYIHAKLMERAGNFKKGSISCLPIAESLLGDLSGYIQTNLMAITDGHIFFDSEVFNQGRRPAINNYLSVTRVGEQAQIDLVRDIGRQLSRFLAHYQKLLDLGHFGSEFEEKTRRDLALGNRIFAFFNHSSGGAVPMAVSIWIIAAFWNGMWATLELEAIPQNISIFVSKYEEDGTFKAKIDNLVKSSKTFATLVASVRDDPTLFNPKS